MGDKKDVFKVLEEYPEKHELNESIVEDAKAVAREMYGANIVVKSKKMKVGTKALIASLAICFTFLAVFLPTFYHFNKINESHFYSAESVYSLEILDITEFVAVNNLNVKYFIGNMGGDNNTANYLIENDKLVFLQQQTMFMNENGFDIINLGVVLSQDRFDAFKSYDQLNKSTTVGDVLIEYKEVVGKELYNIYVKFKIKSTNYYLEIVTGLPEGKLDSYVKMLLA